MGIRGLSTYIHEHLPEVLVRHKLYQRKVVIDGNNLAHILYYECTGINAVFGGDYDKYASFVEEFFKGLQACEVYPIVVMDGGQPLDNKKMNTVRDRIINQIQTCLNISPSSQYRLKVFPCMGRDVFVSTLKKMGVVVLQADFEADLEIAMLAKEMELTVLSNDSDFFMFNVPFILLSSITFNKVSIGKKKRSNEMFNYISCNRFSSDRFCQITGIDPTQFPVFATLLGNDYLAFDHFYGFYNILDSGNRKSRMSARHNTIKNVLTWLSGQKGMTTKQIISKVVSYCTGKNLRSKMEATMRNYTDGYSNLINMVCKNTLKYAHDSTRKPRYFHGEDYEDKDNIFQNSSLSQMTNVETLLSCRDGKKLPHWFVLAYRAHRIPHEVADIVTQRYFISPPQVEDKRSSSAYLLVEPIVKIVYTMLWKNCNTDCYQKSHNNCHDAVLMNRLLDSTITEPSVTQSLELGDHCTVTEMYDSDVVVEEDSDASLEGEIVSLEENNEMVIGSEVVQENKHGCKIERKMRLRWYLRKRGGMWIKNVSHLSHEEADSLPSLSDIETMSVSEKRKIFYSIFKGNLQSSILDLPDDFELIVGFIIFWYQESTSSLIDIHVLSVLVCVFMYYIIDGNVGRVRTRKAFEDEEKWKAQFSVLRSDASYCIPGASVEDTLAQVSQEECLLAGHKLFKFHHMDKSFDDKYYNRKTVHAFSEYQACIYFVQMLNTLLDSPFPLLCIEHLWGGTFCYNIFYDLKKRSNPLMRVSEMLGKGSCLEKLFLTLFKLISETLNFKKYLGNSNLGKKVSGNEKEHKDENVPLLMKNTSKQKKKRGGKSKKKKDTSDKERRDSERSEVIQEKGEEPEMCSDAMTEESDEVDLLDNRFRGLLLKMTQT